MKVFVDPDGKRARLEGELTEADDLASLLPRVDGELVLDLSRVTRINSAGSHAWMRFVEGLTKGARLVLVGCPPAFVYLVTVVADFLGGAEVESVLVPYLCSECSRPVDRLVKLSEISAGALSAPDPCPTCGRPMRLDALEEHYLWLERTARSRA